MHRFGRSGWMWMLTAGATLGLAIALAPVTQAETPDGETPAEETVCDSLAGGEAWGLCNAYCEAMDCDGTPKASDQACERVLKNFLAHDPGPIPCGLPPCVCWDEADLDELVAACATRGEQLACFPQAMTCENVDGVGSYGAFIIPIGTSNVCVLRDLQDDDPNVSRSDLTPEEASACVELLTAKQEEGVCDIGP